MYPYYTDDCTLKKRLIENKVFIATYWPNVFEWCSSASLEYNLASRVIAIPVDQRYVLNDMKTVLSIIK